MFEVGGGERGVCKLGISSKSTCKGVSKGRILCTDVSALWALVFYKKLKSCLSTQSFLAFCDFECSKVS